MIGYGSEEDSEFIPCESKKGLTDRLPDLQSITQKRVSTLPIQLTERERLAHLNWIQFSDSPTILLQSFKMLDSRQPQHLHRRLVLYWTIWYINLFIVGEGMSNNEIGLNFCDGK